MLLQVIVICKILPHSPSGLQLFIPYRNLGNLTDQQKTHNYYLSRARSCIERAFALLKGKWRRLKYFPNYCLDYAIDHILACVVLHNFVILEGIPYQVRLMLTDTLYVSLIYLCISF